MSFLSLVTTGKQIGPQIHVVVGDNGVGKTTFAAAFPKPLFVDLEDGSSHIDVARVKKDSVPNLQAFRAILTEFINEKHSYSTFVIDSAEALEGLIFDFVCAEGKVESIEKYDGGYGKGYQRSREIMREIMNDLQALKAKGIVSVIVAHTQIKTKTDPAMNQTYDRVIMRCNDKMAAVIRDLADNVFYCTYKTFTVKENGKTKAFGDGQRVMFTQYRPGFDAKNRLDLPLEIPLSYDAFIEACGQATTTAADDVVGDIMEMSEKLDDKLKATVKAQLEKYKNNQTKLREIKNRLMKYVS
jgi:hypothetical protein